MRRITNLKKEGASSAAVNEGVPPPLLVGEEWSLMEQLEKCDGLWRRVRKRHAHQGRMYSWKE